jgi:lipoic acid synthetase
MLMMEKLLGELDLHTICQSALCPNITCCFCHKTATFLILGDVCTRNCTFCAVRSGIPLTIDEGEPHRILEAVNRLGLEYVIITSVTRDDLPYGSALQFARTINLLHKKGVIIEVLIPDFLGSEKALEVILAACPQVIGHNIETVPRLYPIVRCEADYKRSLEILSKIKKLKPKTVTKSSLMLGLGEMMNEVIEVMQDLRTVGCDLLTIGQYLQPSPECYPVSNFFNPEEFACLEEKGRKMGFAAIASAPLVRSSYRAAELYYKARWA